MYNYIKKILISTVISIILLFIGYFSNNQPIFTGENIQSLAVMESLNKFVGFHNESKNDSVVYINTSFDKQLVQCYEKEDFPGSIPVYMGNTEITDRNKLINLLNLLKDVNYRYLIIDIKFAKGLESYVNYYDSIEGKEYKTDGKLFSLIKQLDRVVIATHHEIKLIDKELEKKSALADYRATATVTNFVRYEYFDSIPYIPLTVYNDLNKRNNLDTISCHYPFGLYSLKPFAIYTQGCRLCYNSLFLDFSIHNEGKGGDESGHPFLSKLDFYNLSKDILETDNPKSIVKNFKDHYIFIGNISEDIHDTYAGPQPGCVILYKAIKALDEHRHIITLTEIFLLFSLYFFISFFILCGKNLTDYFYTSNNALINFIVDTSTFTFVFGIYHVIAYLFGRTSFSFVVPILVFSALKTYIILKNHYHMNNKFLIILIAIISGFLMSFTPEDKGCCIKIHSYNSSRIVVDGKAVQQGMMISSTSKISFTHPKEWVKLLNKGDDIKYWCRTHNQEEIWKNGDYRKLQMRSDSRTAKLFWWITWHETSTKGAKLFDDIEYLIGDRRPFEIQDQMKNFDEQYYEFTIISGKYKGKTIIAYPDDEESVIWITREQFSKYIDSLNNSLTFKVDYHNYGEIFPITDSVKIVFIK